MIVLGFVASVTGESLGFWLGRRHGIGLVRRLPLVNRLERRIEAGKQHFRKHGVLTVAFGRYATGAGSFVPFVVGMGGMPFWRFLAVDLVAVAVWAVAVALLGYTFGRNLDLVDSVISHFGWAALAALAVVVLGRILWKRHRRASERSK